MILQNVLIFAELVCLQPTLFATDEKVKSQNVCWMLTGIFIYTNK